MYRFVMQLEQLIAVAEKSAVVNALIQDMLHPDKIALLIQVFVESHPSVGQLVLRIFQTLIRMGTPQELIESAINLCKQPDAADKDSKTAKLLA